jgi:hypothetical protein
VILSETSRFDNRSAGVAKTRARVQNY